MTTGNSYLDSLLRSPEERRRDVREMLLNLSHGWIDIAKECEAYVFETEDTDAQERRLRMLGVAEHFPDVCERLAARNGKERGGLVDLARYYEAYVMSEAEAA